MPKAIGILDGMMSDPPQIIKPVKTNFGVQAHFAKRAHLHYDCRLSDPTDPSVALSWAVRYFPKTGERRLAIQQPDHETSYIPWQGIIPSGYGAGIVKSKVYGKATIISSNKDKINFIAPTIGSKNNKLFTLVRTNGKRWIIINRG